MDNQFPKNIKKQGFGRTSWIRLDNASKIFPATMNQQDTKVFRVTAELNEAVDPKVLQEALNTIMPRFPMFNTVLRRGVFWYYFEQSNLVCTVQPETEDLYEPLYIRSEKQLPYRVLYYGSRINAEIFHAVCDGAGAVAFLKALLGQYLLLRYPEGLTAEDIQPLFQRSPAGEKVNDSFKRHFSKSKLKNYPDNPDNKKVRVRAWNYKGTNLIWQRANLIEGLMPISAVLEGAHRHDTTLTIYIAAIYARALWEVRGGDSRLPIVLAVPVNLRALFRSKTERNFFSVMKIQLPEPTDAEASDLDWWISITKERLPEGLKPEKLAQGLTRLLKLESHPVLRVVPTVLKDLGLRIAHRMSDREMTTSISNVGRIDLPEKFHPFVRSCYVSVATRGITMTAISSVGNFSVCITSAYKETELQYRFFRTLQEEGVPVEITSNRNIITSEAGDPENDATIIPSALGVTPTGTTTCANCGCEIRGYKARCPLDNEPLFGYADARSNEARDVFPAVEAKMDRPLLTRLFIFISIAAMVISLMVTYTVELPINLPLITLLGVISTWTTVGSVVTGRKHVSKIVASQVAILSILMLVWDWSLGWQGWSLNLAIPIILLASQASLYILAQALHLESSDYMIYLLLCALLGLVPLIFLIFSWTTIRLPSVICVGVSFLMIAGAFIFQGDLIKHELSKRLHI